MVPLIKRVRTEFMKENPQSKKAILPFSKAAVVQDTLFNLCIEVFNLY